MMMDRPDVSMCVATKRNQNYVVRFCPSDSARPFPTIRVANDPVLPCDAMRRTVEVRSHATLEHDTIRERKLFQLIEIKNIQHQHS